MSEDQCPAGAKMALELSERMGRLEVGQAVIGTKMDMLVERMDRHGRVVSELATSHAEKMERHDEILLGGPGRPGLIGIAEDCKIEMTALKNTRNGWIDWIFRAVITALIAWVAANTTVIIRGLSYDHPRHTPQVDVGK